MNKKLNYKLNIFLAPIPLLFFKSAMSSLDFSFSSLISILVIFLNYFSYSFRLSAFVWSHFRVRVLKITSCSWNKQNQKFLNEKFLQAEKNISQRKFGESENILKRQKICTLLDLEKSYNCHKVGERTTRFPGLLHFPLTHFFSFWEKVLKIKNSSPLL